MNPEKKLAAIVLMNAMNVNPSKIAEQMMKILAPVMGEKEEKKDAATLAAPDLERFAGLYWSEWGETIIVPWKNGLAALDLPSGDPMGDLTELKPGETQVFRRVRKDNKELGEEVHFQAARWEGHSSFVAPELLAQNSLIVTKPRARSLHARMERMERNHAETNSK